MKRISALLLSAVMVLAMTGCSDSGKPDVKKIYQDAITKSEQIKSADMDSVVKIDMDMGGMTIGVTVDADIKFTQNDNKIEMIMNASTELMGQSVVVDYYFTNGYYYMNMAGQKVKYPMDLDEITEQIEAQAAGLTPAEYLDNMELTEQENGDYKITYTIRDEMMALFMDSALASAGDAIPAGSDMTVNNVSGELVVDKDSNIKSQSISMDFKAIIEGTEANMTMKMDMVYKATGGDVTLVFPDDLDTYIEVDPASIQG